MAIHNRGGVVSRTLTIAVAKSLTANNPKYNLGDIDLESSACAKSLLKRIGLTKQMSTTDKIEITAGAKKEAELLFMQRIVTLVEERNIPPNLVMNLDQTLSKQVLSGQHALAKKGCILVPLAGSADRRSTTAT